MVLASRANEAYYGYYFMDFQPTVNLEKDLVLKHFDAESRASKLNAWCGKNISEVEILFYNARVLQTRSFIY